MQWGAQLFRGALMVALPGVTALLIVNLAFGVVSRAAPSLNLFAVGFPVTLVVGLADRAGRACRPMQAASSQLMARGVRRSLRTLMGGG